MKNLVLFIFFLSFFSCKNHTDNIYGTYKSKELTFFQKVKYNNTSDIRGLQLNLKPDSTFNYNACGIIFDGFWKIKHDSLYLSPEKSKWKKDSLNKIKEPIKNVKDFFIYKIEDNNLFSFIRKENHIDIIKLEKE